jgi:hypothetical protein
MKKKNMPADYSSVEDQRRGWAGNLVEQFKHRAARKEQTIKALQEKQKTKQQKDTEHVRNYNLDRQGSTAAEVAKARQEASRALPDIKVGKAKSPRKWQ